jgi:hypothetical protein
MCLGQKDSKGGAFTFRSRLCYVHLEPLLVRSPLLTTILIAFFMLTASPSHSIRIDAPPRSLAPILALDHTRHCARLGPRSAVSLFVHC